MKKDNQEFLKTFSIGIFIFVITSLILSFMNEAFIPTFLLLLSLYIFSKCYMIKDMKDKKKVLYILFSIGVLLIIGSLGYTFMRIL